MNSSIQMYACTNRVLILKEDLNDVFVCLVTGRTITKSANPLKLLKEILRDLNL